MRAAFLSMTRETSRECVEIAEVPSEFGKEGMIFFFFQVVGMW